jgi:putative endonuclease
VYILASRKDGVLYIGATTDLIGRIYQHRIEAVDGFTKKYRATRLVYYEVYDSVDAAFAREANEEVEQGLEDLRDREGQSELG